MCGLFGMMGDLEHKDEAILKEGLVVCSIRGDDSTGIIKVNKRDAGFETVKQIGPPTELFNVPRFRSLSMYTASAMIGHCRKATVGRISRFTASGDVALAGSEVILMDLPNLSTATNHNGGAIHFGPDGTLFVAVGDNANGTNSQTLTTRLGKVLRITSTGGIPTDNPFFNQATGDNRSIWALGVRNPFTFSFQESTQRMFINDVGENTGEEINDGIAGSN